MRKALLFAGVGIIVAALFLVPMPLVQLEPGSALSVPARIELSTDAAPADVTVGPINGDLLLTTVRLGSPTAVETVTAWIDDTDELVLREAVVPPEVDADEFFRQQLRVFEESATVAAAVAERAAGFDVTVSGDGALVAAVLPGSPADGELRTGDVIVAVDGETVDLAADVGVQIAGAEAGQQVSLTIERDGAEMTVDLVLEDLDQLGQAGIGVALHTDDRRIDLPVKIELTDGGIGGPSAGLMLALTVYDQLVDEDIADGRVIAGTGTIDTSGAVGPVGGVEQKVETAEQADATIFLAPADEADLARSAAGSDLRVIAVETFEDALDALRDGQER